MNKKQFELQWFNQPEYVNGCKVQVTKRRPLPTRCDICTNEEVATQKFIGLLGNEMYVCGDCTRRIEKADKDIPKNNEKEIQK